MFASVPKEDYGWSWSVSDDGFVRGLFFCLWYWKLKAYRLLFHNYFKWKLFQYDKYPNQVRNPIPAQQHAEVSRTLENLGWHTTLLVNDSAH
jgi:hypothetical protein